MAVPTTQFDWAGLSVKSVLWVYALAMYNDIPDDTDLGIMTGQYNTAYSQMEEWDQGNPSPNYLSDGDKFSWATIASPSGLGNFTDWDEIHLFAHGRYDLLGGSQWMIGGTVYTTTQVTAYRSSGVQLYGCGYSLYDNDYPFDVAFSEAVGRTQNYLYE